VGCGGDGQAIFLSRQAATSKKSADVVKGQNERYYDHWKRSNEGITPVVVKDVDRPSIVV
jgi:hypothetical protein